MTTLFHLVDGDGRRYANFIVPRSFDHGQLPRVVQFQALLFSYERPLAMHSTAERAAHQYRYCVPLNVTNAQRHDRAGEATPREAG